MSDYKLIGRYKVKEVLGRGVFSTAYLCRDHEMEADVVAKVFNKNCTVARYAPELWRFRFLLEARTMATFNHPNILRMKGFGRTEDMTPYYIMPFMKGSLKNLLGSDSLDREKIAKLPDKRKPKRLSPQQSVPILRQALHGLGEMHKRDILHRDIKPHNILLTEENGGIVKITDFTMIKLPEMNLTRTAGWIGTEEYIAPEQRKSAKYADARADVFSMGLTAYRMMTGTLPSGVTKPPRQLIPAMGINLDAWIMTCMSKNKEDRPRNALDALRLLNEAVEKDNAALSRA